MMTAEKLAAIRGKAELLAGHELGEHGDALTEMAVQRACAYCNRPDVPEEMEQAVASLVLALSDGGEGGSEKSVTLGDTSVTYAASSGGLLGLEALAPWRRLGTLREDSL